MSSLYSDIDKVRASNEGDAFHVVWTARRCLRLLNFNDDPVLTAVAVEGISSSDYASKEGILNADTTEYYGAESFAESIKFVMVQLKYFPSFQSSKEPLTVSDVKDTFKAFAKDFEEKCNMYGESFVTQKATYLFVTNRSLSENFHKALMFVHSEQQVTRRVAKAIQSLQEAACLSDDRFKQFVKIFKMQAAEDDRITQEWKLGNEIDKYLPDQDTIAPRELRELIRRKALLEGNREPIRKLDVLQAFKIPSEDNLFPAPPSKAYRLPEKHIPRIQEQEIADEIITTTQPIIIHATGGIGKSVLALSLPNLMPKGSQCIIFDGFADGRWREPGKPRHKHDRGLVQIANELAVKCLCDPLLPTPYADKHKYIEAFLYRLKQAAQNVRQNYPEAIILIILDAADNSQMAADLHDPNTRSFPIDLLNTKFPPNCRSVVLARTERIESHLNPPSSVKKIKLNPFTENETSRLLKGYHPNISNKSVKEFHRMTSANPRGQFYALNSGKEFNAMMSSLGRNPLGIDEMIGQQLHAAVSKVKEDSASDKQIDKLCIALAALPPLVPISILAKAANVTEPLVRSFISDIGHYLMEIDGFLHFRDEPAETWFRINFAKPDQYAELILALKPLNNDPYVAMALPELMYQAGLLEELISLSLSNEGLSFDSPVEQRRIVLHRVRFSLKAAIEKKQYLNIIKLTVRAGEEVAGNNREAKLLLNNYDLVSKLFGAKRTHEIVFRHHPQKWLGAAFAHGAAMLSGNAHSLGEARNMLRCAENWLIHWAALPDEEKTKQPISEEDKEAIAFAHLAIHGPKEMVSYLEGWRPHTTAFIVGAAIIRRLIDAGNFDLIDELATLGCKNFYFLLAVANELAKVGRIPPKQPIYRAIKLLLAVERIGTKHFYGFGERDDFLAAIISLAEAGTQLAIPKKALIQLLNKYMPEIPPQYTFISEHNDDRGCILRFHCLKGALEGLDIQLQDVAPERIKKDLASSKFQSFNDEREFKDVIGILLPWYKLRAQVILGLQKQLVLNELKKVKDATKCDWGYGYHKSFLANELVALWLDILVRGEAADELSIRSLKSWMESISVVFYIPTRISLTRVIARCGIIENKTYEFAKEIEDSCESDRSEANVKANYYTDLARAVLNISENEALAYFSKALDILNRFGDEVSVRWDTIISLANKAGTPRSPNPELFYTYARTAEVVSEYIGRNFPWGKTICAASKICPSSAFAIIARWHDRDKGAPGEMLPTLTASLLNDKLLSPESAVALNSFEGHWDITKLAEAMIQSETPYLILILNEFIHDIQIRGNWENAAKLNMVIRKYGLFDKRLEAMVDFQEKQQEKHSRISDDFNGREQEELELNQATPNVNWEEIIGSKTFLNAGEIDTALQTIEVLKPYWPFKILFEKIRNAVPRDKEVQHLKAIINSSELDIWQIIHALEDAKALWKNRAAVQKALKHIAIELLEKKTPSFADSSNGLDMKLESLEMICSANRNDLIAPFLKGVSESLESIDTTTFFVVGQQMVGFLSSEEAKDALEYALGRMQVEIKESDGDGPWHEELKPIEDISGTVAGYIYAALGNPQQEYRWQAAHAVVRLCKLGEIDTVASLIKFLNNTSLPEFTDRNLPFYYWHSRLYLMIALARAAKENPALLKSYIDVFLKWALDEPRHIVISHFAAQAALIIEDCYPSTVDYETLELLKKVNLSSFSPRLRDKSTKSGWSMAEEQALDFYFPYDFARYWIGDLSDIFALPYSEVATPIQEWIFNEGGNNIQDGRIRDPRRNHEYYKSLVTMCQGGYYPQVDSLEFYLSYHATFFNAANLLSEKPTAIVEDWQDNWDRWLQSHFLSRTDGFWVSDRRDPVPLERRRWQREVTFDEQQYENWKWSISVDDFDEALMPHGNDPNNIVIRGSWNVSNNGHRENISIRSATVSSVNSGNILKALQCDVPHNYSIPDSNDSEVNDFCIPMYGWVHQALSENGLDKFDHLSGDIPWPPLEPAKKISRLLKLSTDSSKRCWKKDKKSVIYSQLWGNHKGDRHTKASNYGERLVVDLDFLLGSLQKYNRDLVVEVRLQREEGREKEELGYIYNKYTRIYILKANGQLCTLYGSRFLKGKSA